MFKLSCFSRRPSLALNPDAILRALGGALVGAAIGKPKTTVVRNREGAPTVAALEAELDDGDSECYANADKKVLTRSCGAIFVSACGCSTRVAAELCQSWEAPWELYFELKTSVRFARGYSSASCNAGEYDSSLDEE